MTEASRATRNILRLQVVLVSAAAALFTTAFAQTVPVSPKDSGTDTTTSYRVSDHRAVLRRLRTRAAQAGMKEPGSATTTAAAAEGWTSSELRESETAPAPRPPARSTLRVQEHIAAERSAVRQVSDKQIFLPPQGALPESSAPVFLRLPETTAVPHKTGETGALPGLRPATGGLGHVTASPLQADSGSATQLPTPSPSFTETGNGDPEPVGAARPLFAGVRQSTEYISVQPVTDENGSSRTSSLIGGDITEIRPTLDYAWGDINEKSLPADFFDRMEPGEYQPRQSALTVFQWTPTNLWHKPLYFEDPALERYGHTYHPIVQPFASSGRFIGQFVGLPYQMTLNPPQCRYYPLGWYRPGECAPKLHYQVPFNEDAAANELLWMAGLFLVIP